MLTWFDAKPAQAFGAALAEFVAERLPHEGRPLPERKRRELLPKMFAQVERFRSDHRLNVYKKAKLANAFKWRMRDFGYEPEFVELLTQELLTRL